MSSGIDQRSRVSLIERLGMSGRVAVVTGGSRGIGRAIALGLADLGAGVVVASRTLEACESVAREIEERGRRSLAIAADTSREGSLDELFAAVDGAGFDGVDVFVHAAGIASANAASETSRRELASMFDLHVLAAVRGAQLAAARMKRGGSILFVSSVFGLGATKNMLAYGTAKAALAHAAKSLAVEWASRGIRVNAIAPGFVDTDMTAGLPDKAREALLKKVPLERAASPEEIAHAACFLLSDAASYVTGHVLVIDGGERAR
jgi:NAD(P)-dependent dehydrogenase (short-subunit alcohol dehydrogenase family)